MSGHLEAQQAQIYVNAAQVLHAVSPYLTGACLEDVNHEVYGGLYSQMIFGESFQEPATSEPITGFTEYAGTWLVTNDVLFSANGVGPTLIDESVNQSQGDLDVQLEFQSNEGGDAGFIFQVSQPGVGANAFTGYEVSVSPAGYVVLGRHRQDWEPISQVSCSVPLGQWINLEVQYTNAAINVLVNGTSLIQYTDTQYPLTSGQVGLRNYGQDVDFQNFQINDTGVAFQYDTNSWPGAISGMWRPVVTGSATGQCALETTNIFVGTQGQQITFTGRTGAFGVANQGLNHWGMNFIAGNEYDGCLDARADAPVTVTLSLESTNGLAIYAQTNLLVASNNWEHLNFSLTPSSGDTNGQFVITLTQPGSVTVGYAFLEPGAWGQFAGLPVRKDVAQGLVNQGVTVLRYGGSMVNAAGYRWTNMIGARDLRPPYNGTWYPYSSDGWGIPDFLNFCEAAGFLGIPDFNINETPQDMANFIQYATGLTNSVWGAKRMADGHPQPYNLPYLELGNEEAVNNIYYQKFQAIAQAIWAADSNITLVVGDFNYTQVITNPFSFSGAASGITTLAAQQQILQLANQNNRRVCFDVHVWDDGPSIDPSLTGMFSYDNALAQISGGANYNVVVFELNADHHDQGRALGNALAINATERDGRLPIVTSANCLQPDGENDNGWDQGLLFLNPYEVWLQPPGYVTQMYSHNYQPKAVWSSVSDPNDDLDATAEIGTNGGPLILKVVNINSVSESANINVFDFSPTNLVASVETLSAALSATDTAQTTMSVVTVVTNWAYSLNKNQVAYTFAPNSVTTLALQGQVLPLPLPVLRHRYSFTGPPGSSTIPDSVGAQNATFSGSSGGLDGNGDLVLNGTNGYVNFGPNLISQFTNITVEAWVSINTNDATYARLFDFGDTDSSTGNGAYGMDFSPQANGNSWFEAFNTDPGNNSAQQLLGPSLAGAGLMQVVVVYDPQLAYATIYTNGVLAVIGSINIPFSSFIDSHDYLGRSGYNNDPYLSGTIKEFRVYTGDMTATEVAADYAAGSANVDTNIASLTNIVLTIASPEFLGQEYPATITANYRNVQNVNVALDNPSLQSGNTSVLGVGANLTLTPFNPGITTVVAAYGGLYATQMVTVLPPPLTLTHRYEFNEPAGSLTFTDLVGNANGTVIGSAYLDSHNLVLSGGTSPNNNNYGSLPAGLISGYTAVTFEFWVTFGTNPSWGRLIDFGQTDGSGNGAYCIDFTPHSGNNPAGVNFEVSETDPGFSGAQEDASPPILDNSGYMHLVLVDNPYAGTLIVYTNGVQMVQINGVAVPLSALQDAHSYLGKSSYSGDPNGVASVDEFRIYDGAMSPSQVLADYVSGADTLPLTPPILSVAHSGAKLILSWPTNAAGYAVQTASSLTGTVWNSLPGNPVTVLSNGTFQITVPITNQTSYYRLTN
jgi:hypothetical protein